MFNGIIYNQGTLTSKVIEGDNCVISIKSSLNLKKKSLGSSICCNGACLTLTKIFKKKLFFYLSKETINKTNFKNIKIGKKVNLEKPMKHGQDVSGHFVQGHVDTTGILTNLTKGKKSWILNINIPHIFRKFLVYKSSICINGVSLTISKITDKGFQVTIIPHTLTLTNLVDLKKKDIVNIELDMFSKYMFKFLK
tara:strand:+ start:27 stop:611 length:585 start_codon:yes stop_codon:yes gene_type:complete